MLSNTLDYDQIALKINDIPKAMLVSYFFCLVLFVFFTKNLVKDWCALLVCLLQGLVMAPNQKNVVATKFNFFILAANANITPC